MILFHFHFVTQVESNSHAGTDSCTQDGTPLLLTKDKPATLSFSYSVEWEVGLDTYNNNYIIHNILLFVSLDIDLVKVPLILS